jgi:predicted O-methyltransferase YrrM
MESQGQIIISSERCELIIKTIQEHNCQKIVEIGTWKGMGSTLCILNSMTPTSKFITLESNKTFYDIAKNNLESFQDKVKMIYGTIVSIDEFNTYVSNLNLDK